MSNGNLVEAEEKINVVGWYQGIADQANTVRGRASMETTISKGHPGITLIELIKVR